MNCNDSGLLMMFYFVDVSILHVLLVYYMYYVAIITFIFLIVDLPHCSLGNKPAHKLIKTMHIKNRPS